MVCNNCFEAHVHTFFHVCEQAWYMGKDQYVPASSYDGFMNAAIALSSHGAAEWWKNAKPTYAEDFVHMIDELRSKELDVPNFFQLTCIETK